MPLENLAYRGDREDLFSSNPENQRIRNYLDFEVFKYCLFKQWNMRKLLALNRIINATQKAEPTELWKKS